MEKILSVSIASYNVEKFIRKALDSCCIPEIMDRLEVLVVNDGSTDGTLQIAREYEKQYPQTFRVIDKKNGGYGSTVNASIQAATGKYFRLLDGDDWFDRDGLVKMIGEGIFKNLKTPCTDDRLMIILCLPLFTTILIATLFRCLKPEEVDE